MASDGDTSGAALPPTTADDVGAAHARWWGALLAADEAALATLLADDWTFHNPYGTTGTKAGMLENLRSGRLRYDAVGDAEPLIRLRGQAGVVTGRVDIQLQWEGRPQVEGLYYTAVYGWAAPHWRMLAWQATVRADAKG